MTLRVRALEEGDRPFIFESWLRAAWDQQQWLAQHRGPYISKPVFMEAVHARIERLLDGGACITLVATFDPEGENTGHIAGYVCRATSARVLHMVYVKGELRSSAGVRWGLATNMLALAFPFWPRDPIEYTQHTGAMVHLARRWNATYNPFHLEGFDLEVLR